MMTSLLMSGLELDSLKEDKSGEVLNCHKQGVGVARLLQ